MIIVTKQSVEDRKIQLAEMRTRLSKTKQDMEDARSQGDLRENFGYQEAKKDVANLSRTIEERTAEATGSGLQIVEPLDWSDLDMEGLPRAMVGAYVTIEREGKEESYLIGGAWDSAPKVLSYTCPLAKAIMSKKPGTMVTMEVDGTPHEIRLVKAEVASKETILACYAPEKAVEKPKAKKPTKPAPGPEMAMD